MYGWRAGGICQECVLLLRTVFCSENSVVDGGPLGFLKSASVGTQLEVIEKVHIGLLVASDASSPVQALYAPVLSN